MRVTYHHQLLCAEKKLLYCFTLASAVIFARKKRDIHVWKATHWGLHIEMHLAMSPLKKFHALLLASSDHHETDWWQAMKCLVVGREGSRCENWSKSAVVTCQIRHFSSVLGPPGPLFNLPACLPHTMKSIVKSGVLMQADVASHPDFCPLLSHISICPQHWR